MRSDKSKSGNMEIGARVQAGMEVTVNRASQEQWQNQDRKYEKLLENACESRSDDKYGFQNEPFSAQSAKYIIFCTAQGGKPPPKSGGFEASFGMETSSCTRPWQTSFFENVIPTECGEHIFIKCATI